MVLPADLVLPNLIWLTAAIRWDIFLTEEKVNTSLQMIHLGLQWRSRNWVSNKKYQAVSNTGVYESNDQNEVTELSDSEKNFICLHALELEGHRYWDESRTEYAWRPWEALELVAAVIFDFGIFSLKVILQGLASELLTKMIDCFFDKILFISPPTGISSENFFMGPVKNAVICEASVGAVYSSLNALWAMLFLDY